MRELEARLEQPELQSKTLTQNRRQKSNESWALVAQAFNTSTGRQRQADLYNFKTSLVYRESSRIARSTQREALSQCPSPQKKKRKKNGTVSPSQAGALRAGPVTGGIRASEHLEQPLVSIVHTSPFVNRKFTSKKVSFKHTVKGQIKRQGEWPS